MERDGERWRGMERDGERWREMEREGERWREMGRDGERWREMESDIQQRSLVGFETEKLWITVGIFTLKPHESLSVVHFSK